MKIKKGILITIFIMFIFLFLATVNASDNTTTLEGTDQNTIQTSLNDSIDELEQSYNHDDDKNIEGDILTQNSNEEKISEQLKIEISSSNTTELKTDNTTIKIIFISTNSFFMRDQKINIYEDNILIKNISFSDGQIVSDGRILDENGDSIRIFKFEKNFNIEYTDNSSYLTSPLFINIYSNTIKLEKNIYIPITDTNIIINNQSISNKTWNNSIKSLEKAIKLANNNDKIYLDNIYFIQDTETPILIDKNITIIANNVQFKLQGKNTLFKIAPNAHVNFINVTFTNNAENIISNEGTLKLINSTFKENNIGLITNTGNLELENCIFQDFNQYILTPQTKKDGLIINNGTLKIKNTKFNNRFSCVSNNLIEAIIYNNGKLNIDDSNFTNINCRVIYNNAELELNNVKIENITSTKLNLAYELTEEIINNHSSRIFYIKNNDKTTPDGGAIYNNNTLTITNTTFTNIKVSSRGTTIFYSSNGSGEYKNYDFNLRGGAIFNNNMLTINNTTFQAITGNNGGAIFNNNMLTINNTTFQAITGNNGGAIYNNNTLTVTNSIFEDITANGAGGVIYNSEKLNIQNTILNHASANKNSGGIIYNSGECIINNTLLSDGKNQWYNSWKDKYGYQQTSIQGYGGGISNNGFLYINNSTITQCYSPAGSAIFNNGTMNMTNTQILKNTGGSGISLLLTYWGYGNYEIQYKYNGVITNAENKKATIINSTIKDNDVPMDSTGYFEYFGVIHNYGDMEIYRNIFDNNKLTSFEWGGKGALNIYNRGTITAMYNYIINCKLYYSNNKGVHTFLYSRSSSSQANINYNYYCSDPNYYMVNRNPGYYFLPTFDEDYYPIKLNETQNITLHLYLTNGKDIFPFDDWEKLPNCGLNATIFTTVNGTEISIPLLLKDNATFNFNHTNVKGEYKIFADVGGWQLSTDVDVGKEFPNMIIEYNNITCGENITFYINLTGKNEPVTGTVTITFNGDKYTKTLINGTCNITLPTADLKANSYPVKITYDGNSDYFKVNNAFKFKINKNPINITLNANDAYIGQTGKLTITIAPNTGKMTGYLYVDGEMIQRADTQSTRTLNLKNFGFGSHNITVIFKEDDYYEGGQASIIFNVKKYETNLTIQSKDIMPGENATVNITINPGEVRGNATICINGVNQSIFLSNTTTPITIHNLKNGTYYVAVYYHGDTKYAPSNATTSFKVLRNPANMTVEITNNDNLTGNVVIKTDPENCTGEIGIYVNNDFKAMNLTNGCANFTIQFKKGTNYIYILYLGDNYYDSVSWNTTTYIVGKVVINAGNATQEEHNTLNYPIIITDEKGNPYEYTNVSVSFQDKNYTIMTNENGTATLPINTFAGTYEITITYNKKTLTRTVNIIPTKMNMHIKDILAGQNETITIQLPQDATGNITFIIDNQTQIITKLINGQTTVEIENLTLGKHTLEIKYSGDNKYTNQTVKNTFDIKNSISSIKITTDNNTMYGETIQVTATVTAHATGNVTFVIDGQTQTVNITNNHAIAIFKNINAGTKTVTAHYNGDSIYQGSTANTTTKIEKATPVIQIKTSELNIGENIEIKAIIDSPATGNITFTIQGLYSPRDKTIINGTSTWLISPLTTGSYNLIAIYEGDSNYNPTKSQQILIISQTKTKLTLNIPTTNADDDLIIYATLTDENNQKINGNVTLDINGEYYKIIINNGAGQRNLGTFKPNKYTYAATYKGTEMLSRAVDTGSFEVKANNYKIIGNKNINQYYGANKIYKVQILNNNIAVKGEIAIIKINKKTLKVKTDSKGYATLKIQLKPGTYTITTTYKTIKTTNKIKVKSTLITKNKKIKKGKTLKYTAKLLNKNGKILKKKKITFKIKGKKYKAKTNNKGIAKIKIKNLKVGKYKIITSYGKQKNTNTITVKK